MARHRARSRAVAVHRPAAAVLALLVAGFGLTMTGSAAAQRCAGSTADPARIGPATAATAVVCEINRERASRGLPLTSPDPRLTLAGERYARVMVRQRFFAHVSPGGRGMTERLERIGYLDNGATWAVGEVLAYGTGRRATPAAIVAAWMDSPPHRRVLLNRRYRDVGIGVALGIPRGSSGGTGATYAGELGFVER